MGGYVHAPFVAGCIVNEGNGLRVAGGNIVDGEPYSWGIQPVGHPFQIFCPIPSLYLWASFFLPSILDPPFHSTDSNGPFPPSISWASSVIPGGC